MLCQWCIWHALHLLETRIHLSPGRRGGVSKDILIITQFCGKYKWTRIIKSKLMHRMGSYDIFIFLFLYRYNSSSQLPPFLLLWSVIIRVHSKWTIEEARWKLLQCHYKILSSGVFGSSLLKIPFIFLCVSLSPCPWSCPTPNISIFLQFHQSSWTVWCNQWNLPLIYSWCKLSIFSNYLLVPATWTLLTSNIPSILNLPL